MSGHYGLAAEVIRRAVAAGQTLGTAESLTAGLISATLAEVPGASAALMGGVVSYDPRIKQALLGVPQAVIDGPGVVSEPCARQMAEGARHARQALGADDDQSDDADDDEFGKADVEHGA